MEVGRWSSAERGEAGQQSEVMSTTPVWWCTPLGRRCGWGRGSVWRQRSGGQRCVLPALRAAGVWRQLFPARLPALLLMARRNPRGCQGGRGHGAFESVRRRVHPTEFPAVADTKLRLRVASATCCA